MEISNLQPQAQLFPVHSHLLNSDGYLSHEAIQCFKTLEKNLKKQNLAIEDVIGFSRESWRNWLFHRRSPSGPSLAFLTVLMAHPDLVINTLKEKSVLQ
ncbi:hypothetical protein [Flavobacterium sp.]|uniref:hypothetical protein n=1 Tax=Flavobacterium sp. TaxID=239 RepID=UPI00262CDCF8|nr:hypothetical protein [Flavobacterium sp.]